MQAYQIIVPITLTTVNSTLQEVAIKTGIGDPGEKILNAIHVASKQTKLSETLLLSLIYSESSFNTKAISSKNYQGLMQIPKQYSPVSRYEDINVLIGARIFAEKLIITKGNYRNALILYKGWRIGDTDGIKEANKVIDLIEKLQRATI